MLIMLPFTCREIESDAEREAVYRLRYDVYVDEMGRRQRHADASTRLMAEPLDATAIHLGAFGERDGELLGALRIHVTTRDRLADFPDVYRDVTAEDEGPFALVTRLVTRPGSRGGAGSAGLALSRAAYCRVLREKIDSAYIDCHVGLVPFFEWLGFDVVGGLEHPDYGSIAVMRIRIHDVDRLERSQSPLLQVREEVVRSRNPARPGQGRAA